MYSWTLHCNYLLVVVWHETFTTSPMGSGVTWPASNSLETSVWIKWSILHVPCEIHQNSDHKWPTGNPAWICCQTPFGCWKQSGALITSLSVIHRKKQISVRGHYCERYIACLSGKQKDGFKFDKANRDCQAWRGHKLVCQEQAFPEQTPKYIEILQREGADC